MGDAGGGRISDALGGLTAVAWLAALWLTLPAVASLAIGLDRYRRLRPRGPRSAMDAIPGS
jgi:hypothetical protein